MEEKAKPFDKTNFLVNDIFGKINAKALFKYKWEIELKDNPDKYGIDLIGQHNGINLKVEACVNNDSEWTSNDNIQIKRKKFVIWQRRLKHLTPSTQKEKCIICMCNKDGHFLATLNITKEILDTPKIKSNFQPFHHESMAEPELVIPVNHNKWKFYEV